MPFYDSNTSVLATNPYGARDETLGMDAEQVECVGTALEHSHDDDRLTDLMDGFSMEFCSKKDELMRLKAIALSHRGRFGELYRLIESHKFSSSLHHQMQRLWDEAHYKETSIGRNKFELDAVTRYRVRKKYPYPCTIWDGEGTSYCFKKRDRAILKDAYRKNHMPSQQEKQELAQRTNLSVTQVSNWFKNQRQRARQQTR
ncbi:Homeobox protein SIX1 [Aphelenchoides avenae]|nr:Homeobox protein SIX1 [Aphelenchus avenae]